MVFDRRSIAPRAVEWYPVPCRLSLSMLQDSGNEQRVHSYAREGPPFDIACFLTSLRDIEDAEFKTASEEVQKTKQSGRMRISLVERGKVDELLDSAVAPQEVESTSIAQKPLPSTAGTADSYGSNMIPETLRDLIWDAVTDDGKNGLKIVDLLDQYKDKFYMIRKVTTERIVKEAARNEHCGEKIMSILLDRLKNEVCKNISMEVVKYAAGNRTDGAQIVRKLLDVCGDVVCEKSSVEVICTAAENEKCGALILESLLKANEERIKRLIMEVKRLAAEGIDWPRRVLPNLDKKLKEISHPIEFRLSSGRQSVQPDPELQEQLPAFEQLRLWRSF